MMAAGSGMPDSEKLLNLFRGEVGYATPKVEVRGAVVRDNQILLVREREDGGWTMPGGWADVGESPNSHGRARGERGVGLRRGAAKAGSGVRSQQTSSSAD